MGNLPNLDLARLMLKLLKMIASRKRRQYRGILPSGSTWLAPSNRMCRKPLRSVTNVSFSPLICQLVHETYLESAFQNIPKLLRLGVAGVLDLHVSSLSHNGLSREGSLGISPSRIRPPLLYSLDLLQILLLLLIRIHSRGVHGCHNV